MRTLECILWIAVLFCTSALAILSIFVWQNLYMAALFMLCIFIWIACVNDVFKK